MQIDHFDKPPDLKSMVRELEVRHAESQPPMRNDKPLKGLERLYTRVLSWTSRHIRYEDNPLVHLGAMVNFMVVLAVVSGIILLLWYTPSHTGAYASIAAMEGQVLARIVRGLHRYSSDAALFLALLHAIQMMVQKRFAGPRKLAWVTGWIAMGVLWFVGWIGYWLVWDERAQAVAVGSSKMLDLIPIFTDPVGRSFLIDKTVSSLLFFVIFFMHMLLPLMMVVSIWLHLTRLSRPHFMPTKKTALYAVVVLVILSLLWPATLAKPAAMTLVPSPDTIDGWFLLPIYLMERLSGGLLWLLFFIGAGLLFGLPRLMIKKRDLRPDEMLFPPETDIERGEKPNPVPVLDRAPVAVVDPARCNACENCYNDCPYGAISMIPRTDGRNFASMAFVDASACVGCGICVGSCDSAGVGPIWPRQLDERKKLDGWLSEKAEKAPKTIIYACAHSAAAKLEVTDEGLLVGGDQEIRVISVPCAGWTHPLTMERAIRRGAEEVLVIGCSPEACVYREGASWTSERMEGKREPELRRDKVGDKVKHLIYDLHEEKELRKRLGFLPGESKILDGERKAKSTKAPALFLLMLVGALVLALGSEFPYVTPDSEPELVVSFQKISPRTELCYERSEEELRQLPPHQRVKEVCERGRENTPLKVWLDGELVWDQVYQPGGAFGDGITSAVARIPVAEGKHQVRVLLGQDSVTGILSEQHQDFSRGKRRVLVLEEGQEGFEWH